MVEHEGLEVVVEICERDRHATAREVKARCAAITIGIAAFEATKERHPHERVMLRHGARILRDTARQPKEDIPGRSA